MTKLKHKPDTTPILHLEGGVWRHDLVHCPCKSCSWHRIMRNAPLSSVLRKKAGAR